MFVFKVTAILATIALHQIECSVLAPAAAVVAPVVPAVRYGLVAPQNIRPFAAQVSTFTRGLNVFAAPYAAGVFSASALLPGVSAPVAPGVLPAAVPAPVFPAVAPAPLYPAPVPAFAPAALPVAPVPVVGPSHLLPAPFARSIHAVAPAVAPAYPALGPAPFLG